MTLKRQRILESVRKVALKDEIGFVYIDTETPGNQITILDIFYMTFFLKRKRDTIQTTFKGLSGF